MTVLTIIALMCLAFLLVVFAMSNTDNRDQVIGKLIAFVFVAIPFAVLLVGLVRG